MILSGWKARNRKGLQDAREGTIRIERTVTPI